MTTVTLTLSDDDLENLEIIQRLSHTITQSEAVAISLDVSRKILEENQKGNTIYFEKSDFVEKLILNTN